jgi:hypothetical protein
MLVCVRSLFQLTSRFPGLLKLGICALWLGATIFSLSSVRDDGPLDHDEVYWIGSAYYFELAWVQHDFSNAAWRLLPARENPPIVKYVLGMGLAAAGHHIISPDALAYFYLGWLRWENDLNAQPRDADAKKRAEVIESATPGFRKWVVENRHAPITRAEVLAARRTAKWSAAVASLLLLVLVATAEGWLSGLVASQLLLLHPVVRVAAGQAMSDMIALGFSLVAVSAVFWWNQFFRRTDVRWSSFRGYALSVFTGVTIGVACAAKMNALIVLFLFGAVVVQRLISSSSSARGHRAGFVITLSLHGIIVLASALIAFIASNPAIWGDIRSGLGATVTEHQRTEMLQMDVTTGRLNGWPTKSNQVVVLAFGGWLTFLLGIAAVGWLIVKRRADESVRFAVMWWLVAFCAVSAWIPFSWSRYIIPVLPPSLLLAMQTARAILDVARERRSRATTSLESAQRVLHR